MFVEFSVKNFRSIKDVQTISFMATGLKSADENDQVDDNNIFFEDGIRLMKTIGIYGPNGSGKSNVMKALEYFLAAIKNEASSESNLRELTEPFLYGDDPFSESYFQLVFILDNKKYRYGYTVKQNVNSSISEKASKEIVTSEWLFGTKEKKSGEFFLRKGQTIEKEKLPNQDAIPTLTYEHTLFITHAAAFDREGVCAKIRRYLTGYTISNSNNAYENFRWNTLYLLETEKRESDFLNLLSSFNLHYDGVILDRDLNKPETVLSHDKIFFTKSFVSKNNKAKDIRLNLSSHESAGTQKIFDLAGLLLRAFVAPSGGLIMIDEIDSNFHPALLRKFVQLFNNREINKSNVQLLFTSHDTNLMSPEIMRRDQFYFTEKTEDSATRIYSLADLRGIRNDADFAKQYLAGVYGAVPFFQKFAIKEFQGNDEPLGS